MFDVDLVKLGNVHKFFLSTEVYNVFDIPDDGFFKQIFLFKKTSFEKYEKTD